MNGIGLWWRQPDHYDWLTATLGSRRLLTLMQGVMCLILLALAGSSALTVRSPAGPRGPVPVAITVVSAVLLCVVGLCYLWRWPTRRQSQLLSVTGIGCVAVSGCCLSDPGAAMLSSVAFVGLAGYVAFFHTAPYLLLTLGAGVTTAAVGALRMALAGDASMAASRLLVVCGGILAVPICSQVLVHWLSVDSVRSTTDMLTGLPNRRGFFRSAQALVRHADHTRQPCLTVAMVDLDHFKQLNDSRGHAAGDRVLVGVAETLRRVGGDDTVVARVGGEEFVIAHVGPPTTAVRDLEHLLIEIAAVPGGVTASIGAASRLLATAPPQPLRLVEALMAEADDAMYAAKRRGRNRVCLAPARDDPDGGPDAGDTAHDSARRGPDHPAS